MPQTQDMTPHPVTVYRRRAGLLLSIDVDRHTGIHSLPIVMSWVRPIGKSFPDLPRTPTNTQLYDDVMLVTNQKLSRKRNCGFIPDLSLLLHQHALLRRVAMLEVIGRWWRPLPGFFSGPGL